MAKGITTQEMDATTASGLVPHLGTTTNSSNEYSITTSVDVKPNTKFTLKINAESTGAPTLKINDRVAAPIKSAGDKDAKLFASVYTLFWDGSVFILQGEGGGGTVYKRATGSLGNVPPGSTSTISNLPFKPKMFTLYFQAHGRVYENDKSIGYYVTASVVAEMLENGKSYVHQPIHVDALAGSSVFTANVYGVVFGDDNIEFKWTISPQTDARSVSWIAYGF